MDSAIHQGNALGRRCVLAIVLFAAVAPVRSTSEHTAALQHSGTQQQGCQVERLRVVDDTTSDGHQWLNIDTFEEVHIKQKKHLPFITAEVSSVPCAVKGCCNMLFTWRPNTTDWIVFKSVLTDHFFSPIYAQLQKLSPQYILDGGGNVGFAASLFAMTFPNAQIITVEPSKGNFEVLRMNTARFPNVHAANVGLWDKQAHIDFLADEGAWGFMFKEIEAAHDESVHGMTITELMRRFNFPHLDFVKLDIEGAESRVFAAGADLSWLDHTRLLAMELHDRMAHYYGLQEVSSGVLRAMETKPFTAFKSGEHTFWQHESLGAGSTPAAGDAHHRHA